ncbi:unnamed protein product [Adineta ricciae]|uniref:Methyltransferase domain-containing protein n=2 Tax=Adineta ricciae TaxID=249248 RepID=A0A814XRK3_ADIRI|nr:unnamed protein product [Adineta ricciae]
MTDHERQRTIASWHTRADAYEILIGKYPIFTNMAMEMIKFVERHRKTNDEDIRIMDLAAGTGLISKLLIDHLHLSPSALYLIEPAEQMCTHARQKIRTPHVYQIAAEDCLQLSNIPRNAFDFILCNASMHLMSEDAIYPVISKLLKPKTGYFLYTLWYHAFDETDGYEKDEEFEKCFNDVLTSLNYPKYFSTRNSKLAKSKRSRKHLEETAERNGLKLESCTIRTYRTAMSFDLDFMLMAPNWLHEHLNTFEWTQKQKNVSIKEQIVNQVRELIQNKFNDIPIVEIIVSKV